MLTPLAVAACSDRSVRTPIGRRDALGHVAAAPADGHDVGPAVLDDRVEDVREADVAAVLGLEVEDLGLRRDRAQHVDVERDFLRAVTWGGDLRPDGNALDGRPGDPELLVKRGDVIRVIRVERDDGDRLALAEEVGLVHRQDVVGLGEIERAEALRRGRGWQVAGGRLRRPIGRLVRGGHRSRAHRLVAEAGDPVDLGRDGRWNRGVSDRRMEGRAARRVRVRAEGHAEQLVDEPDRAADPERRSLLHSGP